MKSGLGSGGAVQAPPLHLVVEDCRELRQALEVFANLANCKN